jgi:hypothetical protein
VSSKIWRRAGLIVLAMVAVLVVRNQVKVYLKREASRREAEARQAVEDRRHEAYEALRPVALKNCQLERFGEVHDGGYLVCANLLGDVKAGYSYGISGYDKWGCDVATRLNVVTHQYDCFNTTVPTCERGRTMFHPECVAGAARTEGGRPFDSIASQLEKNGDAGRRITLKIDVEGAEWESFEALPDDVLQRIDQLVVEFHIAEHEPSVAVLRRLRKFFHVAHYHANTASCVSHLPPFTSWAFEVLFVNRRLDQEDATRTPQIPHPLDATNGPKDKPCRVPTWGPVARSPR